MLLKSGVHIIKIYKILYSFLQLLQHWYVFVHESDFMSSEQHKQQ